jgi:hypothetical protein
MPASNFAAECSARGLSATRLEGAVTEMHEQSQAMSTGPGNSLMLFIDLHAGEVRVIDDARSVRELADATRAAQQKGDLQLMATIAA